MHGARERERETLALLAEELRTVITLSSIYGNNVQHNILENTFFYYFWNEAGSLWWGSLNIWGAFPLLAHA